MRIAKFIGTAIFMAGLGVIYVFVVMSMWNWLMPAIFGLPLLTMWQSFGLIVLLKFLFLGHGWHHRSRGCGYHHRSEWKKRFTHRWDSKVEDAEAA